MEKLEIDHSKDTFFECFGLSEEKAIRIAKFVFNYVEQLYKQGVEGDKNDSKAKLLETVIYTFSDNYTQSLAIAIYYNEIVPEAVQYIKELQSFAAFIKNGKGKIN